MKKYNILLSIGLIIAMAITVINCGGGAQVKKDNQMPGIERIDGATLETVQEEKPLSGVGPFSTISIGNFTAPEEIQKEYGTELTQFRIALLSDLKANKAFSKVYDGENGAVNVTGKIIDMRITSSAARFWGGAFAGSSNMDIYVKITDKKGKVLKEKIIASSNSAMGAAWTGGSSDKSMPLDMGKIVSAYLVKLIPTK